MYVSKEVTRDNTRVKNGHENKNNDDEFESNKDVTTEQVVASIDTIFVESPLLNGLALTLLSRIGVGTES